MTVVVVLAAVVITVFLCVVVSVNVLVFCMSLRQIHFAVFALGAVTA